MIHPPMSSSTAMNRMTISVEERPTASSDMDSVGHEQETDYDVNSQPSGVILRTGRVRMPDKLIEYLNKSVVPEVLYWQPDGISFSFHGKKVQEGLLDKYFHGTKLSSFTRSLNRWGFQRVFYHSDPKHVYTYRHALFQKNRPDLVKDMKMPSYPSKTAAAAKKAVLPSPMQADSHRRTASAASSLSVNSDSSQPGHSIPHLLRGLLEQATASQNANTVEQGTNALLQDWVHQLKNQANGGGGVSQAAQSLLQNLAAATEGLGQSSSRRSSLENEASRSPANSPRIRTATVLQSLAQELEALAAASLQGNNHGNGNERDPAPVLSRNNSNAPPQVQQALLQSLPHMSPSQQQQALRVLYPHLLQNQPQAQQQQMPSAAFQHRQQPPDRVALLTLLQAGLPAFFPPQGHQQRRFLGGGHN